jgi:RimJ/RimL family protein N-acetyltransferase
LGFQDKPWEPFFMLTTKRLTLRAPREDDLHAMFAVYSNSNAMKYWFTPLHEDISVTKNC